MTKGIKIVWVVIILLCGALGWFFFLRDEQKALPLPTEKPTYGYIAESVTATGTIQPLDTVSVGTQVSGVISVLNADYNSVVKKGQLLAQLDRTLLKATLDQNAATLRQQRSQLAFDKSNFERQKQLYATGSTSTIEYERALNAYNAAASAVENAEAQLRSSSRNLSFTDIYSPIDGVVLSRNISIGQTVAAMFNTPTLFVIARDITKMQVQASIDEADIGQVRQGQRALFTVDAFMDDNFKGTVAEVRLQPRVSSNVVSYSTIINAPNEAMKLKPGMTANIIVYTKELQRALRIPAKALNFSPDSALDNQYKIIPLTDQVRAKSPAQRYVWVKKGDTLTERQITVGINNNAYVQVLSGLSTRDEVVTSLPAPGSTIAEQITSVPVQKKK
ncbi:efflux RND transporter periplasmic adaptor subunit [Mucilaginibacter sp. JRF]|uniref:efflux RND transporter periplasmic adaptor subunit n=1 Tax=Mucilaginibacter sp. JRF TaxID=2780088 RepID=UPI00187FBC06|nr:efflux RND transporter periplasmic adaptor subunit [Mucilaginibacter sp. JRF]MBE9584080.1 efflux RND transporter periplasmic adaptor subunit [Mucilaginibacter sp. JRF]